MSLLWRLGRSVPLVPAYIGSPGDKVSPRHAKLFTVGDVLMELSGGVWSLSGEGMMLGARFRASRVNGLLGGIQCHRVRAGGVPVPGLSMQRSRRSAGSARWSSARERAEAFLERRPRGSVVIDEVRLELR